MRFGALQQTFHRSWYVEEMQKKTAQVPLQGLKVDLDIPGLLSCSHPPGLYQIFTPLNTIKPVSRYSDMTFVRDT